MDSKIFIEVKCEQGNHVGEDICGDVFHYKFIKEENRIIAILADGMGHGVKANMMATLTATMALGFRKTFMDHSELAEKILNTLPESSKTHTSYSTFSIIDIEIGNRVSILEYGNPECILIRGLKEYRPEWEIIPIKPKLNLESPLRFCSFVPEIGDRIFAFSDGITQSGLGSADYPVGYGRANLLKYISSTLKENPTSSAGSLAIKIKSLAFKNDHYIARDDMSCVSIYFREPRKLLVATGPPYENMSDHTFAEKVKNFDGRKIVCGATTAEIIARELHLPIKESIERNDPELPPTSEIEGFDLVSEGILTLSKVSRILTNFRINYPLGKGPADQIIRIFIKSDEIYFLTGTGINPAHHNPTLPVDIEIRRAVIPKIAFLLEEKLLKKAFIEYI